MSINKKQGEAGTTPAPRKTVKKIVALDRGLNTGDSTVMEAMAHAYAPITEPLPAFWLIAHELRDRSEGERLERIQTGFSANWVRATREAFKLSNERLEALLNASISTLERRQKQQQPLDAVASERLDRVAMVATQALDVFEAPEKASRWMVTVNAALGDETPIHLCESEIGARQVRRVLAAMEYGGVV
ncbi:MAG: hypothetical protein JWP80_4843 [Pseudomonas sp.]|nr:hypothetical protein [Pseudomonas sp.]